jgi:DNA-binding transcriptional MerR regulator
MMYIGKLAESTGATRKAIRLYESLGLIPIPVRQGTYRVYSDKDVVLVNMIRRAQTLGFNLAELKELAVLKAKSNRFPIEITNELIASKREKLRKEMDEIMSLDRRLTELESELNLNYGNPTDDCLTSSLDSPLKVKVYASGSIVDQED